MPLEDWIQHSRVDEFLYDWQTVIAGVLAFVAGVGTVVAAIWAIWATRSTAREQIDASREDANKVIAATREQTETTIRLERERVLTEDKAMRLTLALDIRRLVDIMLQTHANFDRISRTDQPARADAVIEEILRAEAIVFPALAGRFGLLEFPVAGHVLMFHTNLKQIEHQGRRSGDQRGDVPPADLRALVKLIELACRQNVLPLLSELPQDENNPDTERKTKIEAMGALAATERI